MTKNISGVLPIIHTPLLPDDQMDEEGLQRQVDWAFSLGADGCCTGMVSELLRLTGEERVELNGRLAELVSGRGVAVAGVGAESIKQAVLFGVQAARDGCDAIMATPPIATALPEDALLEYFQTLADKVDLPLIVQDASAYVGQAIPLSVQITLLDRYGGDKILFKPEAAPIGPRLSMLRDQSGGRARILEGSGGILLVDSFRRGIAGTMPGMDLLDGIVALWRALHQGDDERAYRLYFPICALVALQMQAGLDGLLAIEKYILVRRGLFTSDRRRKPFAWSLDPETAAEVDRLLDRLQAALKAT